MNVRSRILDLRHSAGHNITTVISGVIFAGLLGTYISLYFGELGRYPDSYDINSILNTALPLALVGVGQTIVVVTRGMDLSVGGVMSLANVLAATRLDSTADLVTVLPLIVLIGCLAGLVNGLLVAVLGLAPILVTLGTMSVFGGLAIMVLPNPGGSIPAALSDVLAPTSSPLPAVGYLALVLLGWFVLRRTRLGVGLIAIGNDEAAAAARGIDPVRTKVAAYVLSGGLAAVAGIFFAARAGAGDPLSGNTFVLSSIAAVFLGGASLFGGRASAVGTLFGALTLTLITSVLFFAQINPLYQAFYEGVLLIVAVGLGLATAAITKARMEKVHP